MSMKIVSGSTGIPGLFNALNDNGAFIRFSEEPGDGSHSNLYVGYVSEQCYLKAGIFPEESTSARWIDSCHLSPELIQPIYTSGTTTLANNQAWEVVVLDTGFLFGISTTSSGEVPLKYFIGKTVNKNGVESMGIVTPSSINADRVIPMTDENPGVVDVRASSISTSKFGTKLSQVTTQNTGEKFKDVFMVHQTPYTTQGSRLFTLDGNIYYAGNGGYLAIRFGGV